MIRFSFVADVFFWLGFPLAAFAVDRILRPKATPLQSNTTRSPDPLSLPNPSSGAGETLSLPDLLHLANAHYADGWLAEYFDPATGEQRAGSGDTLAQFIVAELSETFAGEVSTAEQLEEARRVLYQAIEDLHRVIRGFDIYEERLR